MPALIEELSWHLHDMTDEKRERTVQALRMLADYVQDTKDPQANAQEVWVVETMVPYASLRSCPSLLQ